MNMSSLLVSDAYKQSHIKQYPPNTELVYSNWTPRNDKYAVTKGGVVVFGIQAFLCKLITHFNEHFFDLSKEQAVKEFVEGYTNYFGEAPDTTHVEALHDEGYLPIKVKALPEGSICPIGVPMLTLYNTKPEFFWLTNFLETIMSTELWLPATSATIAHTYKKVLMDWSHDTCDNDDHVQFQGHDFSMRGMAGLEAAAASGAAHLLSFTGSDTIPAVYYLKEYYDADPANEMVGVSIPATEHSVMSMGSKEDELGTFRRLITDTYPGGLVSIVSDTWDLWKVCTEYLPKLKDEIMARDGKVVIRPDSGNPVDIICGEGKIVETDSTDPWNGLYRRESTEEEISKGANFYKKLPPIPETKGVIELLWDIFGGTVNKKGYKVLDPHIGAIYGDSITLKRADEICRRLEDKGFASSNIVFGIGSYTYQFNTRDVYGFAMKATYGEVDGQLREIFKDPITDDGMKKSLKGLMYVIKREDGTLAVVDQCTWDEEATGELKVVFEDGVLIEPTTLTEIRERLNTYV